MEIKSDSPFISPYKQSYKTTQCRVPLLHTAQICDRFGISNRADAALATATLKTNDLGAGLAITIYVD